MTFAYSKEVAYESIKTNRLNEKYDENRGTFHHVTFDDLEHFARIVAYKVAHNLKNGFPMNDGEDPLTYVDCGNPE